MTPQEALEILKNASGLASLTRADHLRVMQAIGVIEPLIRDSEKKDG